MIFYDRKTYEEFRDVIIMFLQAIGFEKEEK